MKKVIIGIISIAAAIQLQAQDFVRMGAIHDFSNSKIVSNFSFAFNRTEAEEADVAKYLYFNRNNKLFILPTSEVNLGDGVTSSENNVMAQVKFGKVFLPPLITSPANPLIQSAFRQSIELNPTYNADKEFKEQLYFGQLRYAANYVSQVWSGTVPGTSYIKKVHSFAVGPFANFGARSSKIFDQSKAYVTAGAFLEYQLRTLNSTHQENWVAKISGNYYYILSDLDAITNDEFGGKVKVSLDRRVYKKFAIGLEYKYGNDNPKYAYVHTLGLSAKISY